ncbi:hypothetical protein SAY87_019916 [Trapa incisa]|uniref:Uncharacterized protein n=1 Tax=Trapa incisa TaxID=236973 RepID=A0AAN7Q812_9MYRT|nr:hypothetical protein SAY87_019916 [Trapa incisa]
MGKFRGFRMKKPLISFTRWIFHRPGRAARSSSYHRLDQLAPCSGPFSGLLTWGRRLTGKTRSLCCALSKRRSSGYLPFGEERPQEKPASIPKGHLVVYVGQKDGDFRRVMVPVIHFNHPLFGELLREAEEEFGFSQQGGITIPCGVSEFERIQNRIASTVYGVGGSRRRLWKARC